MGGWTEDGQIRSEASLEQSLEAENAPTPTTGNLCPLDIPLVRLHSQDDICGVP